MSTTRLAMMALVLALPTAAFAQGMEPQGKGMGMGGAGMGGAGRPDMRARLQAMDVDRDGAVSAAEIQQARIARFDSYDGNRDGAIEASEIDRPAAIARLDRDKDGRISRAEYLASEPRFMMLDRDRNGALSSEELAAAAGAQEGMVTGRDVMTVPPR